MGKDKEFAVKLISKYFRHIIPKNYKYKHEIFIQYEEIAKRYAILEILETHKNSHKKDLLIEIIREL